MGQTEAESTRSSRKRNLSGRRRLLSQRISDLSLTIHGSRLEPLIGHVYKELGGAGIVFRPDTYLSDEWGCPSGTPVIGIPFYLADPVLCTLEDEMTGVEAETDAEVIMYLRHEVGHAFNYAYRLYDKRSWRDTFGQFSRPYREEYKPVPFSMDFVRHSPGWYAQKHPDDDFAETFAVWLDPTSAWREKYAGTGALAKLNYIGKAAARYGRLPPVSQSGALDMPVEKMTMTLDTWYERCRESYGKRPALPPALDIDLARLFPGDRGPAAEKLMLASRQMLIRDVNNWTGVDRHLVAGLVDAVTERIGTLKLKSPGDHEASELARVSAFLTTLAMNHLRYGRFIPE